MPATVEIHARVWLNQARKTEWSTDNPAPMSWVQIDLSSIIADDLRETFTHRELAKRWGWSKSRVARLMGHRSKLIAKINRQ